nr:PREDICTED: GPI-anchor transamidase [Equus przewalskii]
MVFLVQKGGERKKDMGGIQAGEGRASSSWGWSRKKASALLYGPRPAPSVAGELKPANMAANSFRPRVVTALAGLLALSFGSLADSRIEDQAEQFFRSGHTNNWAVLVCTSRFWFNYRHVANTLSVYRSVKRLGIPDRQQKAILTDSSRKGIY